MWSVVSQVKTAKSWKGEQLAVYGFDSSGFFNGITDEDVVHRARRGDERATEFLLLRYRPLVETKARSFFLLGADHEDVVQEGMIGLCKAIRDFRDDRMSKFRPFAELCVTRQIITAVKTATRQKHLLLSGYLSLNSSPQGDDIDCTLLDTIPDKNSVNPEEVLFGWRIPANLNEAMRPLLSDLEKEVMEKYLEGKSYREMAREIRCGQKTIDNALQRIKRKITLLMSE